MALVVQTLETGGGYTLGFRVDPAARLVDVYKELDSLFSLFSVKPIFGVQFVKQNVRFELGTNIYRIESKLTKYEIIYVHTGEYSI